MYSPVESNFDTRLGLGRRQPGDLVSVVGGVGWGGVVTEVCKINYFILSQLISKVDERLNH